nr:MAG TPA: Mature oligodendrocyte transmembrane protein [Caudoviricetes sp.]
MLVILGSFCIANIFIINELAKHLHFYFYHKHL